MHLLNTSTLKLHTFYDACTPPYAILSHTWGDDEVTYDDYQSKGRKCLEGNRKIQGFCSKAVWDGYVISKHFFSIQAASEGNETCLESWQDTS